MNRKIGELMIVFNLAEGAALVNDETEIDEVNLKRMKAVYPLYLAYRDVFGSRVCLPVLCGTELHIRILADTKTVPYTMAQFIGEVEGARADLHDNVNREELKPHAIAVRSPAMVPFLRAVQCACSQYKLTSTVHSDDGVWSPPELGASDFAEPLKDKDLRQTGEWPVVGLRRDDVKGHQLLITANDLFVRLPLDDPKWSWLAIHQVLEEQMALVGTLVRENKTQSWTPDEGTALEPRGNLSLI